MAVDKQTDLENLQDIENLKDNKNQGDSLSFITDSSKSRAPRGKFYFPWLTLLICLAVVTLQALASVNLIKPNLLNDQQLLREHLFSILMAVVVFIGILEYWLFTRRMTQTNQLIAEQHQQVTLYSQSKKKQQRRANQYSDHTEKLKGFIADKLIEYMDFDEKFIHFKGIAAEVRHNGVISYDKITTALNKAIEQQGFLSLYEQQNSDSNQPNQQTIDALVDYQGALDAMRYLWALLDLSTADNMSLHIGNQLIESEENFYRLQLDKNKSLEITQSIPVSPTFEPQLALLTTFSLLINEPEINNKITLAKINHAILQQSFYFENDQFRIKIEPTPELLGNPNHIILLLENLIKNAQFFLNKSRYKQSSDRVGISLEPTEGSAQFVIYNRGPQIEQQVLEDIFKLGFSTRRSKEHHGKGLGLYFAKEIVNGYQGSIVARNLNDQPQQLLINITLADQSSISFPIECQLQDQKVQVRSFFESSWAREFKLGFAIEISQIEVIKDYSKGSAKIIATFEPTEHQQKNHWLDPTDALKKTWSLEYQMHKKHAQIKFKPLAIEGVEFEIKLPTAESHLEH